MKPDRPQLLVLGYQRTLQPDPKLFRADDTAVRVASPPWMEILIEPLLAEGLYALEHRVPAGQRVLQGEPVPLNSLLGLLRERLEGILTQAIAACAGEVDPFARSIQRDLIREFPVLRPLLRQAVSEWVVAIATFHERLHLDAARLAEWLGMAVLPPVEALSGTASDTHSGHIVLRIVFTGRRCLYYKPRAVTGEWLWHRLLESVAEAEPALRLPAARVLAGGNNVRYGWMESVLSQDVLTQKTVASGGLHRYVEDCSLQSGYWHAAGAMLCLAQHVRLTDLHLDNIVATPNGPAVTDAECLGTPEIFPPSASNDSSRDTKIGGFLDSLLDTGLLPRKFTTDLPDASGLFGAAAPVPGIRLPQWILDLDGRYQLTRTPAALLDRSNAPARTSALAVLPQILNGYRRAAEVLLSIRKTLIAPGAHWRMVLERRHAPRVVLRDTLTYSILLSQSLEPDSLRSGHRRRGALLHELRRIAPASFPASLLRAESYALLRLHVPRLINLPGTRTLASGSGRSLVPRFAARTPAEAVLHQIEALSPDEVEAVQIPALMLAILDHRNSYSFG